MVFKAVLFVFAQALLAQSISGQCIGAGWAGAPWSGLGAPCGGVCGAELVATPAFSGGALPVASASTIPPNGVSVLSENAYAGELVARGALPFLGTAALEGVLPTAGAGAVAYGCGNGEVAMLTEGIGAAGIAGPLGYGTAIGPYGYGYDSLGYGTGISPLGYGYGYGYEGCNMALPSTRAFAVPGFAASSLGAPFAYGGCGVGYGGEGIGDIAVAGILPVEGSTLVAGRVPIMGAVGFDGIAPAAGEVAIAGSCGCGCRGPYLY